MSDSDASSTTQDVPTEQEIEKCLRQVVRTAIKNEEQITVNRARELAEAELDLDHGYLKNNAQWKDRSKSIINEAFDEPESPAKKAAAKKQAPVSKRKSVTSIASRPAKKTKLSDLSESDGSASAFERDDSDASEAYAAKKRSKNAAERREPEHPRPRKRATKEVSTKDESNVSEGVGGQDKDLSHSERDQDSGVKQEEKHKSTQAELDDMSDLSSVIDVSQRKERQKKPANGDKPATATSRSAKPKAAAKPTGGPDEEEIKRLQSWLMKCGVRKLWHRELGDCDTAKDKIRHLKRMLADIGMTGRYSVVKAKQIKDARELAADLEAVQDFAGKFGDGTHEKDDDDSNDDDDDDDATDKQDGPGEKHDEKRASPARSLPKGFVDFGDSGEESD